MLEAELTSQVAVSGRAWEVQLVDRVEVDEWVPREVVLHGEVVKVAAQGAVSEAAQEAWMVAAMVARWAVCCLLLRP